MSSFMLLAVEIAWICAFSVAARLPEIPAVAVPMAAGEAPRTKRVADLEEVFFMEDKKGRKGRGGEVWWLGLGETRRHFNPRGGRSGNLLFWGERKNSRQWMQMRSGCLFCSPCCGNSSVLKLLLGGKGISLLLCVAPPCGGQTT